jgi:8-oxo-dGTP pyrophosphatase MutT (NUDIX family)
MSWSLTAARSPNKLRGKGVIVPEVEQASVPKESATVILVRSNPAEAWEVFLACRHRDQSFMAAAYVFPGGQVDAADTDAQLNDFISAPDHFNPCALLQDNSLTSEMAQSFFICAIRETFEEAGVLIARDASGQSIKIDTDQESTRFADYRRELNAGRMTLKDIAQKEKLLFSPDDLVPYAHWITPEISPKRFSTRFFLARLPEGQSTITDCNELTDCLWATPKNILKMHYNKEIMLMPPTLKTLEELAAYATIDTLFSGTRDRTIYPILPQHSENFLKLPHDPEYSIEKFKVPARPDEPSRIINTCGIWQTGFYQNK